MLVDIHCHLDHEKIDADKIVEKAKKSGVKEIITSGVNTSSNRKALKLSEKYDIVKASFGIYPIDALNKELQQEGFYRNEELNVEKELAWIEKNKEKCLAIGECGLDYKWSKKEKEHEKQKKVFEKVIKLAKRINKPLIIHSRKAEKDALELLEKNNMKKLNLHCFNGKKSLIRKAEELGYYFSIPPIITRLEHFQMLVNMIPLNKLLTETDSPYLSPERGKINKPSNVKITIKEIAKIKNLSEEEVEKQVYKNYKKLFY